MPKQSRSQKQTVSRVMHEYKHGELKTRGNGPKVKNQRQAVAIALQEAGASNQESAQTNRRNLHRTKAKEARGQTAEAEREDKAAQTRTMKRAPARRENAGEEMTKKALYAKAQAQHVAGRSKMSKAELARGVH